MPEAPGLGVEVDEAALSRLAQNSAAQRPDFIGVLHLPAGHKIYSAGQPRVAQLTGKEEAAIRGIAFERWVDDGSAEFARVFARVQTEGWFLE